MPPAGELLTEYKNTKKHCCEQKIKRFVLLFKTILLISQTKIFKNNIMELEGKVIAVLAPREGTSRAGNQWKAQEYVIETMEQYPKKMCFEVFGTDRIANFEPLLQIGNNVRVSFDIDARQWQDRWFNSIRAWKVEAIDSAAANAAAPGVQPIPAAEAFPPAPEAGAAADTADDLPF